MVITRVHNAPQVPTVPGPAVNPEVLKLLSDITQLLGLMQTVHQADQTLRYRNLRKHIPGLAETSGVGFLHTTHPVGPSVSASEHGSINANDSTLTGAKSDQTSGSDDDALKDEAPLEAPKSVTEKEAFNKAIALISPKSATIESNISHFGDRLYLPSAVKTLDMVEWDTSPCRNRSLLPPSLGLFKHSNVPLKDLFSFKLSERSKSLNSDLPRYANTTCLQ